MSKIVTDTIKLKKVVTIYKLHPKLNEEDMPMI